MDRSGGLIYTLEIRTPIGDPANISGSSYILNSLRFHTASMSRDMEVTKVNGSLSNVQPYLPHDLRSVNNFYSDVSFIFVDVNGQSEPWIGVMLAPGVNRKTGTITSPNGWEIVFDVVSFHEVTFSI